MTRLNLPTFLSLSLALHAAALAHWSAPILPSGHPAPALSIDLVEQMVEKRAAPQSSPPRATVRSIRKSSAPATARNKVRPRPTPAPAAVETQPSVKVTADKPPPLPSGPPRPASSIVTPPSPGPTTAPRPHAGEQLARADLRPTALPPRELGTTAPAPVPTQPETAAINANDPRLTDSALNARLRIDLARHFSYPAIARRRGWEGAVRLKFTVQSDGRLTDVRIVQSSGYRLLDSSALRTLQGVGYLPEAVAWVNGQTLDVELPVIYRLRGR